MIGAQGLDPDQRAAVDAPPGGLFISAGAGSGKTRVLAERFIRLVEQRAGDPSALDSVVAITFTDRAAGELTERIRARLSAGGGVGHARRVETAWIGTIHGMCARLLRRHALAAGLDPAFRVLDEIEQGTLSHAAFEAAVRASTSARGLAAEYGAKELERAVTGIAERLRSTGAGHRHVLLPEADPGPAVCRAVLALASVAARLAPHARTATALGNLERLERLSALLEGWRPDSVATEDLLTAAAEFGQGKAGSEEVKALAKEAEGIVEELSGAVADAVCEPRARAFVALLGGFSRLYAAAKDERGVLDFTDLQVRALALLEGDRGIASGYRARFAEVMVDEFQDTDALQLRLVDALSGGRAATVGDERQSIYAFRNADVEVFRRRASATPPERRLPLSRNYRSHPDILRFLNAAFTREPFWPDGFRRLEEGTPERDRPPDGWPADESRVSVCFTDAALCGGSDKARHEADAVSAHLAHLRDTGAARPGEMVVLLRAMTNARAFSDALTSRGFEVVVASGATYFETAEAEELGSLVRVIANAHDDEAFARVLAGRMAGLSDDGLALLRMHAESLGSEGPEPASLWDAARDPGRRSLPGPDEEAVSQVVRALTAARARRVREPLSDMLLSVCRRLDHDVTLFAAGEPRAWANVMKFARMAEAHERLEPGDARGFIEHLGERREHGRGDTEAAMAAEGSDAVRIMSVHAAKGLDLPVVAVAGLGREIGDPCPGPFVLSTDGTGPVLGVALPDNGGDGGSRGAAWRSIAAAERQRAIDEEKRVLYVACTRAAKALVLSGSTDSRKEPGERRASDWVRRALGLGEGFAACTAECGIPVPIGLCGRAEEREAETGRRGAAAPAGPRAALARERLAETATAAPRPLGEVSYSALQTYRDCAYKYFVEHVLRMRSTSPPGSARAAAARLGAAFHGLVATASPTGPDDGRVRAVARAAGLDRAEEERLRVAVDAFFASDVLAEALGGVRVAKESGFAVDLDGTVLHGAMDMISWRGEEAFVLDYKTGERTPDLHALERYRLQGACYALAAIRGGASSRVRVEFVHVERGCESIPFAWTSEEGDTIAAGLRATVVAMRAGSYEPLPGHSAVACPACPALGALCPISAPGAG